MKKDRYVLEGLIKGKLMENIGKQSIERPVLMLDLSVYAY